MFSDGEQAEVADWNGISKPYWRRMQVRRADFSPASHFSLHIILRPHAGCVTLPMALSIAKATFKLVTALQQCSRLAA